MLGFLNSDLLPVFHPSGALALKAAQIEAVDTGSLLLEATSLEMAPGRLVFVGTLPFAGVTSARASVGGRRRAETPAFGRFHTTWSALVCPEGILGYLVLRQPVTVTNAGDLEDDRLTVAVGVTRRCSIPDLLTNLGPTCCSKCNQPLSPSRLAAVPGTRWCVRCQQKKENARGE